MRTNAKSLIVASMLLIASYSAFATNYAEENTAYRNHDYATAIAELAPLAAQGDADAQLLVGFMYQKGSGVPQDFAEAMKLFKLAASKGNNVAPFNLGIMYEMGVGVPASPEEAFRWYQISANAGYVPAQSKLGYLYGTGRGITQNYKLALHWTALAAKGGDSGANQNLPIVFSKAIAPETINYNHYRIVNQGTNSDGSSTTLLVTDNPSMAVIINSSRASVAHLAATGTLHNCRHLIPEQVDVLQSRAAKMKIALGEMELASRLAAPGTSPLDSLSTDQRVALNTGTKLVEFVEEASDAPYYSCDIAQ